MPKVLLGLDIGSTTIKAVQLTRDKNNVTLNAAGYIPTPKVDPNMSTPHDEEVIANTINQLVHDMKLSSAEVCVSLPSYKVTTQVIEVPLMNEKEIESSIQWEAEQYIPLPLSKVKLDYAVIGKNEKTQKIKLILVAAPIILIERYMRIITLSGLTPIALETEILATARSIIYSLPTLDNVLLTSIGAVNTEIAIIHSKQLIYTKTYPVGGNTLTRAIIEDLGFEIIQAEEYKKTYGIEEDKLEGKLAKILTPFFSNLFSEIEKTVAYFKEEFPKEEINTIVFAGGTAKLQGLMLSATKNIGFNSQVSNPFVNINVDQNVLSVLTSDAAIYTTAVGLALKEI